MNYLERKADSLLQEFRARVKNDKAMPMFASVTIRWKDDQSLQNDVVALTTNITDEQDKETVFNFADYGEMMMATANINQYYVDAEDRREQESGEFFECCPECGGSLNKVDGEYVCPVCGATIDECDVVMDNPVYQVGNGEFVIVEIFEFFGVQDEIIPSETNDESLFDNTLSVAKGIQSVKNAQRLEQDFRSKLADLYRARTEFYTKYFEEKYGVKVGDRVVIKTSGSRILSRDSDVYTREGIFDGVFLRTSYGSWLDGIDDNICVRMFKLKKDGTASKNLYTDYDSPRVEKIVSIEKVV